MFEIVFDKQIKKDLKCFSKKTASLLIDTIIEKLSVNPFPKQKGNPKKLKGNNYFRLRIGDYRVLYEVDNSIVKIFVVLHRKDVYKKIK